MWQFRGALEASSSVCPVRSTWLRERSKKSEQTKRRIHKWSTRQFFESIETAIVIQSSSLTGNVRIETLSRSKSRDHAPRHLFFFLFSHQFDRKFVDGNKNNTGQRELCGRRPLVDFFANVFPGICTLGAVFVSEIKMINIFRGASEREREQDNF